jgi:hypothetical protein
VVEYPTVFDHVGFFCFRWRMTGVATSGPPTGESQPSLAQQIAAAASNSSSTRRLEVIVPTRIWERVMTTQQQDQAAHEHRHEEAEQLHGIIGQLILDLLGRPPNLHRLQVRHLWADRYRVNVLVGADATCAKVEHSYFVVVDGAGNITASTPRITKKY